MPHRSADEAGSGDPGNKQAAFASYANKRIENATWELRFAQSRMTEQMFFANWPKLFCICTVSYALYELQRFLRSTGIAEFAIALECADNNCLSRVQVLAPMMPGTDLSQARAQVQHWIDTGMTCAEGHPLSRRLRIGHAHRW